MLSLVSFALALPAAHDYASMFSDWKAQFGKVYASASHESEAFSTWAKNHEIIEAHNALGMSYTLGHNEFSDISASEFFRTRLGFNASLHRSTTYSKRPQHVVRGVQLADVVDWVEKGAVTPVKNQGACGSCWAFSTTGALEGAYAIASGELVSLSEEELVQCDGTDSGCSGGLMDNAFGWIKKNGGINTEAAYGYTSGTGISGMCAQAKESTSVVTLDGFTDVPSGDEDALLDAVAQGPVSVAIEADKAKFQLYKSGVLDGWGCGKQLDHGVLIVGYGTQGSKNYWKVKNSWGAKWGEEGYIRMARGKNMCGIATEPSYPTGAKKVSNVHVEAA